MSDRDDAARGHSEAGDDPETSSFRLDVDGEVFSVRAGSVGGTEYTWLNGPNPGYGFSSSRPFDLHPEQHLASIRNFLAMIDPATGHIEGG